MEVGGALVGQIGRGLLALVGIAPEDDAQTAERMLARVLAYRVFADAEGRMNLNLQQAGAGLLLVPNFTLMADTTRGLRPSFTPAAPPDQARGLFEIMCGMARERHADCAFGRFGADMQVRLINDGPITLTLEF